MRVISQDGTIDVPYEISFLIVSAGRYEDVEHAAIYCHNYSATVAIKMAEYSSKEKAQKAIEVMRKAYTGGIAYMQNVEPTAEVLNLLNKQYVGVVLANFDGKEPEVRFENNQDYYFQFPSEKELE